MSKPKSQGGCLCGGVRYQVSGELRPVITCHCEQCRRTSGHFVAASACQYSDLSFVNDSDLAWYQSSSEAQRGFCKKCGSSLFWRNKNRASISIMAGTIDAPTGLKTSHHIFVADASDYYSIDDDLPQFTQAAGTENRPLES